MKVRVIHNAFGSEFVTVATYETNHIHHEQALQEAYKKTNSIDSSWYDNKDIDVSAALREAGVRSTSVDDFISIQDGETLTWFRVAGFGFEEVELSDTVEYTRIVEGKRGYLEARLVDLVLDAKLRDINTAKNKRVYGKDV